MLQLLLERGVVAHGSAALALAGKGIRSRRREQRLGQAGLAAPRLPDERYRPNAFDGMCHGSSSSRKSFPRCPPIFNRYLGACRGVDTARKISRRNNSRQTTGLYFLPLAFFSRSSARGFSVSSGFDFGISRT